MAPSGSSPTARRYELARRLRDLRLEAGRSVDEVAEELACSAAKVSRIENGQRVATALDVKVLSRYYGLSQRAQGDLMSLAVEARKRGWWQDFRSLDEQTQTYIGLESAASHVFQVEVVRIPGLLQTADYVRSLVPRLRVPEFWQEGSVEQIIQSRLRRQQRLREGEFSLGVVIDEAALSRRIGHPPLMRDQIRQLIDTAELPNVKLQITTYDVGSHPGMDDPFTVLSFADDVLQDTVFLESLAGNFIIRADDKPDIVDQFRAVYRHLSEKVALSPEETLTWLHRFHEGQDLADDDPVAGPALNT